ncbi:MAG: RimK-like ATPgrasp N-terminal domain-containing protein, partial [Verrucomicrobiae bacterium]|nr:RimK-like ATPgrasp N-terminal domain-containing protein [Verrucomicrobiae bacterium]
MAILMVVNNPRDWPLHVPGVEVVAARDYLTRPDFAALRGARVFNCCRSYRYQSVGYYVSLLAAARGHKPIPNLATIQDMKSPSIVRLTSEEMDELIQKSLADIKSPTFPLSIYFGRNLARKHDRLAGQLFQMFHAPFLRAHFEHDDQHGWSLQRVGPISEREIPDSHHPFVLEVATEFFA